LSKDSPNTTIFRVSLTFTSTNVVITATVSVDEIKAANNKQSSSPNSTSPYKDVNVNAHRVRPMHMALKSVFTIAKSKIVPMLLKNGLNWLFK
jgi:hypothetical protein